MDCCYFLVKYVLIFIKNNKIFFFLGFYGIFKIRKVLVIGVGINFCWIMEMKYGFFLVKCIKMKMLKNFKILLLELGIFIIKNWVID